MYASEEAARAAAEEIQSMGLQEADAVTVDSVEVREVVASA